MVRICYASKLPLDYFDLKEDQPLFIERLTEKLNLALAWHDNELIKGVKIKPELVPVFEMLSDLEYENIMGHNDPNDVGPNNIIH